MIEGMDKCYFLDLLSAGLILNCDNLQIFIENTNQLDQAKSESGLCCLGHNLIRHLIRICVQLYGRTVLV